jgi:magnesium chelatase subunit D
MGRAHHFPFSAVVGQDHARAALLLATIDPAIGGVLLRGDKGSAKSTLARGLAALLPDDAPFVELPLGATEDRVLGSLDLRAALHAGEVEQFRPGLLAAAHGGVLYVDEVNLLPDHLVDALLDAAASGVNRVERDGVSHEHAARFVLVGSMNPEEGELRPQLLDRFGLAVEIRTPDDPELRAEAVRRRLAFDAGTPFAEGTTWHQGDGQLRVRLAAARPAALSAEVVRFAAHTAVEVGAESLRADIVLCRAAAALAGWERRDQATVEDIARVAPLVLSHRRRRRPFDPPTLAPDELAEALDRARQGASSSEPAEPPAGDELAARSPGAPGEVGGVLHPGHIDDDADDGDVDDGDDEADLNGPYADTPTADDTPTVPDDDLLPATDDDVDADGLPDALRDPRLDDDTQELVPGPLVGSGARAAATDPTAGGPPTVPIPTQRWQDLADDDALAPGPTPLPTGTGSPTTAPARPRPVRPSAVRHNEGRTRTAPATRQDGGPRGRVVGDRPLEPDAAAADIAVVPTVRAALRRRATEPQDGEATDAAGPAGPAIQQDDLRATQRTRRVGRTVVLAVDTSGSMGTTERVNAATGAVLGLLADSYLRRDHVALVTFRGGGASEVLPPTSSVELARARLVDVETGGATPLAEGIASGLAVAQRARTNGSEPLLVLLTDGRATGDADALDRARAAATKVADVGVDAVVLDAEDGEPLGLAKELAGAMGARYLPLSKVSAPAVEIAVRNSL